MVRARAGVWHLPLPEAEVGEAACEQPAASGGSGLGNRSVAPGDSYHWEKARGLSVNRCGAIPCETLHAAKALSLGGPNNSVIH